MAGRSRVVPIGVGVVDNSSLTRRPSGRAATSLSGAEVEWLDDALRFLITGRSRHLDRFDQTTGAGIAKKVLRMKVTAAINARQRIERAEEAERMRHEKLSDQLADATAAVVDTKAAAE